MSISYKDFCLSSSTRSSHLAGKCSLSSSQDSFGLPEKLRIIDTSASGVNEKCLDANINTDFGDSFRHLFGWNIVAGKTHKPLTGRCAPDRDGFNIAFNRPGQEELELADTRDIQILAFNFVSGLLQCKGVVSILSPESGESGFFSFIFDPAKEGVKGFLQSFYHILQNLRAYGFKLKELLLKFWKLILLINAGNGFFVLPIDANSLIESKIVKYAACFEPLIAFGFSLLIYYGSILECFSHFSLKMRQQIFGQAPKLKGQFFLKLFLMR